MLISLLFRNESLRDAIVSMTSGVRQHSDSDDMIFYQKGSYTFGFSSTLWWWEMFDHMLREYQPEKIFLVDVARSVDMTHEIGDIILPNVFFHYNPQIAEVELSRDNRDSLMGSAEFLEVFEEQKDYYVEDFGLSIGGILVSNVPTDPDLNDKLMTVYEADAYSEWDTSEMVSIMKENLIPTLALIGIESGKIPKNITKMPLTLVAENVMTTIRLLSEDN